MNLLNAFYENLTKDPDKIVYEDSIANQTLTNRELDVMSARVYRYLLEHNVGTEDVVAVWLPRGIYIPAVMLGVIKAGAAFVVIGEHAGDKATFFLNDSGAKLTIKNDELKEILQLLPLFGNKEPGAHDLACIIYSSGSSGYFKGSMHEYGQYDMLFERTKLFGDYEAEYGSLSHERNAMVQGFYGIGGVLQVAAQLITGSYVDIVGYDILNDADAFRNELINKKITCTTLSPSHIKRGNLLKDVQLEYANITFETFGDMYSDKLPLYNSYGLTEGFCDLCYFLIDKPYDITPIGVPYGNVELYLADENANEVAKGQTGEIYVKTGYFRGYINRPEDTKKTLVNGYIKTGDMAYINGDGNYVFLGRKMDLFKTKDGYVIPQTVANEVKKLLGVSWCYVKCFENTPAPIICVYFNEQTGVDISSLRNGLKDSLPAFMLPTHLQIVDKVERFSSGKTNRYAFKRPEEKTQS